MCKAYLVGGVSKKDGVTKVRYASAMSRKYVLASTGHTEIQMFEFEQPEHQEDIVDFLLGQDLGAEANEAVKEEARKLGFEV